MGANHSSEVDESDGPPVITQTDIEELGSQGLTVSEDGSAAMLHCSSTPPNYYRAMYGIGGGINMCSSSTYTKLRTRICSSRIRRIDGFPSVLTPRRPTVPWTVQGPGWLRAACRWLALCHTLRWHLGRWEAKRLCRTGLRRENDGSAWQPQACLRPGHLRRGYGRDRRQGRRRRRQVSRQSRKDGRGRRSAARRSGTASASNRAFPGGSAPNKQPRRAGPSFRCRGWRGDWHCRRLSPVCGSGRPVAGGRRGAGGCGRCARARVRVRAWRGCVLTVCMRTGSGGGRCG